MRSGCLFVELLDLSRTQVTGIFGNDYLIFHLCQRTLRLIVKLNLFLVAMSTKTLGDVGCY